MPLTLATCQPLKSGQIYNNQILEVLSIEGEHVSLKDVNTNSEIKLQKQFVANYCRLMHSIVYAASQGMTLQGRVSLEDTRHPHYTKQMLFVGLSRATAAVNVQMR